MKNKEAKKILEFRNSKEAMEKLFPESQSKKVEVQPNPSEYGKKLADKLVEIFKKELLKT